MTREEAIKVIRNMLAVTDLTVRGNMTGKMVEACQVAIEALKAEPCDRLKLDGMLEDAYEHGYDQARHDFETQPCDAVSREAVLNYIRDNYRRWFINDDAFMQCVNGIKNIVPVTPKQKTSVWVAIDQEPHETWECGLCGFVIDGSGCIDPDEYRDIYKYCPHCGCKMLEGESE